jgi:hypothetical protein
MNTTIIARIKQKWYIIFLTCYDIVFILFKYNGYLYVLNLNNAQNISLSLNFT